MHQLFVLLLIYIPNKGQRSGQLTYQFILQEHLSVFVLNGYEELENFHDLNEAELDYLGITEPGQRAKIMSAVDLMQDTCKFTNKILYNYYFFKMKPLAVSLLHSLKITNNAFDHKFYWVRQPNWWVRVNNY